MVLRTKVPSVFRYVGQKSLPFFGTSDKSPPFFGKSEKIPRRFILARRIKASFLARQTKESFFLARRTKASFLGYVGKKSLPFFGTSDKSPLRFLVRWTKVPFVFWYFGQKFLPFFGTSDKSLHCFWYGRQKPRGKRGLKSV